MQKSYQSDIEFRNQYSVGDTILKTSFEVYDSDSLAGEVWLLILFRALKSVTETDVHRRAIKEVSKSYES